MRLARYLEKLDQAVWLARILQCTTLALAVAVLVLARQQTILHIAPPAIQRDYRIGPTTASKEYLEQMAVFLATSVLTVNPDNAEYTARAFLQHLTPEARGELEAALLGEASYLKKRAITQAFYPRTVDFFSPTQLRVTGTLVQWAGGKTITQRDAAYAMALEVKAYAVRLRSFALYQPPREIPATIEQGAPAQPGPADGGPAGAR